MWGIYVFMGFVFCCMGVMPDIYVLLHGMWECCLYGVCVEHLPVSCVCIIYLCSCIDQVNRVTDTQQTLYADPSYSAWHTSHTG